MPLFFLLLYIQNPRAAEPSTASATPIPIPASTPAPFSWLELSLSDGAGVSEMEGLETVICTRLDWAEVEEDCVWEVVDAEIDAVLVVDFDFDVEDAFELDDEVELEPAGFEITQRTSIELWLKLGEHWVNSGQHASVTPSASWAIDPRSFIHRDCFPMKNGLTA